MSEAQTETGSVSEADVRHVADLANLELTAEEMPRFVKDMNAILGYIAQLNELDVTDVPAMAQVSDILAEKGEAEPALAGRTLRADAVKDSVDRKLVMAEAPETDGRFFKVPKVIER